MSLERTLNLKKTLSFLNPEKGYIYTFSINALILGNSTLSASFSGILSKMTVGFFCHFEKINNAYDLENNLVREKKILFCGIILHQQ